MHCRRSEASVKIDPRFSSRQGFHHDLYNVDGLALSRVWKPDKFDREPAWHV